MGFKPPADDKREGPIEPYFTLPVLYSFGKALDQPAEEYKVK